MKWTLFTSRMVVDDRAKTFAPWPLLLKLIDSGARGHDSPLSVTTKILCLIWLTVVAVAWGVVRSTLLNEGMPELYTNDVPVWIRISFMLMFVAPVCMMLGSIHRLLWLLGASAAVGFLPGVPLIPFLRESAHLVLVVTALVIILRGGPHIVSVRRSLPATLYAGFLVLCVFSIALNQINGASIWHLKVGVTELMLYLAFGVVIAALTIRDAPRKDSLINLVDGFAWAAISQAVVAMLAIAFILRSPLVPGTDAVFGLAYWDRLKTTFVGPDHAGIFFAVSIPLVILWIKDKQGRLARIAAMGYLQLAPWFVIATGSRTGRVALIVAIVACLVRRSTRQLSFALLPSSAFAFFVGFYYRSIPAALVELSSGTNAASLGFKGSFFHDASRSRLITESLDAFRAAPLLNQIFGSGIGVAGYRTSGYPSPHMTPIDVLIEVGLAGAFLLATLVLVLSIRLGRAIRFGAINDADRAYAVLVAMLCAAVGALTWEVQTWGFVMVVCVMAFAETNRVKSPVPQASH